MLYAQYVHHPADFCKAGLLSDCIFDYEYMMMIFFGHLIISMFAAIILLRLIFHVIKAPTEH